MINAEAEIGIILRKLELITKLLIARGYLQLVPQEDDLPFSECSDGSYAYSYDEYDQEPPVNSADTREEHVRFSASNLHQSRGTVEEEDESREAMLNDIQMKIEKAQQASRRLAEMLAKVQQIISPERQVRNRGRHATQTNVGMGITRFVPKDAEAKQLMAQIDAMNANREEVSDHALFIELPRLILSLQETIETTPELQDAYAQEFAKEFRERLLEAQKEDINTEAICRQLRARSVEIAKKDLETAKKMTVAGQAREPTDQTESEETRLVLPTITPAMPAVYYAAREAPKEFAKLAKMLYDYGEKIIHIVKSIRIYAQLQVPAVTDGTNFSADVLSELISALASMQEGVVTILNNCFSHYAGRAAIVGRLVNAPTSSDLVESLVYSDMQQFMDYSTTMSSFLTDLRSVRDTLLKNFDRMKPQRAESHHTLY